MAGRISLVENYVDQEDIVALKLLCLFVSSSGCCLC